MSKVKNVIRLYTEGVCKQSIGERTGLPRNTVRKYIRLFLASDQTPEAIEQMSDGDLEKMFLEMVPRHHIEDDPKFKELETYFPTVEKALKIRGNTKEKLWGQYIQQHPEGYRLSQFKRYYLEWFKMHNPVLHIEHKAADKMYVDYAGEKLDVLDPEIEDLIKAEVFVAILGASQLTYVEACYSQRKEDFIRCCENALHYFGGTSKAIVTDNLKSAVTQSSRYEPTLNEAFQDFASHYSMAVLPAAPYKPKHKALVEGAVKILYRSIYTVVKGRAWSCMELLNTEIKEALEQYNNRLMKGRPYSRRMLYEEIERNLLTLCLS